MTSKGATLMSETNQQHAELHVNEEPRNDFSDVMIGFGAAFGFFFLIGVIFTLIKFFM
jgi:hypothetical protein